MSKILLIIFILLFTCIRSVSQKQGQARIDSLLAQLPATKEDSNKVKLLNDLSFVYKYINASEGIKRGRQGLTLAEKLKWGEGIVQSNTAIGVNYFNKSDYIQAKNHYDSALRIAESLNDKNGIAEILTGIGLIHRVQSNYTQAMDYDLKALKIYEESGNMNRKADVFWDIGNIYLEQSDHAKAIEYLNKALSIYEGLNNYEGQACTLNDMGYEYFLESNSSESFKYLYKALDINGRFGFKRGMATNLISIGINYGDIQSDYPKALEYELKALNMIRDLGFKREIIFALSNIGEYYLKIAKDRPGKHYPDSLQNKAEVLHNAITYLKAAIEMEKETGVLYALQYSSKDLSEALALSGNYKEALETYKHHSSVKDSIFSLESNREIAAIEAQRETELKQKEIEIQKLQLIRVRNEKYALLAGLAFMGIIAFVSYGNFQRKKRDNRIITKEKQRSDELLLNILPFEVAEELKATGSAKAKTFSMVTVLFADFKDFTKISEKVSAELLVSELNYCFSAFDYILQKFNVEKIKTVGDAYMCASGMPTSNYTHAVDMVTAALEMKHFILARRNEEEHKGEIAFEMRIGIHTGPVVAGIVGVKKFSYDIWGDTVNLAARMESSCEPGQVNISSATYELVKDKFKCTYRGKIQAKNKGEIDMYFVED